MNTVNGKTFTQQYRKCSSICQHGNGQGHGPYWYKSAPGESLKYVGKNLPAQVTEHLAQVKAHKAELRAMAEELDKKARALEAQARHAAACSSAIDSILYGNPLDNDLLQELGLDAYACLV